MNKFLEKRTDDLLQKYFNDLLTESDKGKLKSAIFDIVDDFVIQELKYKPILEIRIPSWGHVKVRETEIFYDRIKEVTDGKYLILVLPLRNDQIPLPIKMDEEVINNKEFLDEFKKMWSSSQNQMTTFLNPQVLITDVGTVKIHSVTGLGKDEYRIIESGLKNELKEYKEQIQNYK